MALSISPTANCQSVTGQISGVVTDSQGGAIAGATVKLTHNLSQQTRTFTTGNGGSFTFPDLVPGQYTVRFEAPGFKSFGLQAISVSAQERVDLHEIKLEAGNVNEEVTIVAEAAHVATDSSDRGVNINIRQIQDTPIKGRDYKGILRDLPGVVDLGQHDSRGWGGNLPTINGGHAGQTLMTLDGVPSQDSGAPSLDSYLSPSIDAIGEVKLMVSNYTAEYGARAGGQMNVTIKNGTNQFHGSGYFYWRHEELDANEFFNNKLGAAKPIYRYQNPGGTIGGPVIIPGTKFNKDRKKLFFFFSLDYLRNEGTTALNHYTMPTALERQGNFSQSFNSASPSQKILIKNPQSSSPCTQTDMSGCFANDTIPQSMMSPIGQAFLNLFPLPNTTDPTGRNQYNYQTQLGNSNPRLDKILRIDYNISDKTTTFVRLIQDYQGQDGFGAILGAAGDGWGQFPHGYDIHAAGAVATLIHNFRPNLINEATWGINRGHQTNTPLTEPGAATFQQSLLPLMGVNGQTLSLPSIFNANSMGLLPNISFGYPSGFGPQSSSLGQSIANLPGFGFDSRWPFDGTDQVMNVSDNITWLKGSHTLKFGFYLERMARNVSVYSTYNTAGTYYFGADLANANDTGDPFANALMGSLYAYGEDNEKQINHARYTQIEWFAQDSWKISRRVTLDYGVRFQDPSPDYSAGATLGLFQPSAYNASQTGQLLYPTVINGQKMSINPVTGAVYPIGLQGTFDPKSIPAGGSPYSGITQYDSHFFKNPGVVAGPRIGLAWDIFGNGKTALRTGFGIFYDRGMNVDTIGATGAGVGPLAAPPNFRAPLFLYTTINNLTNTTEALAPQSVNGGSPKYKVPATYNWSFGIQQDLSHGVILDVAYVGNVAHHQFGAAQDLNAVAPYTTWTPTGGANPQFLDPTSNGGFYSANLIRALTGYNGLGTISAYTSLGESNYNSLQVQLNRRFSKNLQFSVNYTHSRTITFSHAQWVPDELTKSISGNPDVVNLNFGYHLPGISRYLGGNKFIKGALDSWELNGVGTFITGSPMTVGCGVTGAPPGYWTGTPTGGIPFRCQQVGPLSLPSGATPPANVDPRLWYPIAISSFTLPPANSLGVGNTPVVMLYGPGVETMDLALSKEFKLGKSESRVLQFKVEAFNAFNHFNPGNPDLGLNINFATGQNLNSNFGSITGAQIPARRCELSLRLRF